MLKADKIHKVPAEPRFKLHARIINGTPWERNANPTDTPFVHSECQSTSNIYMYVRIILWVLWCPRIVDTSENFWVLYRNVPLSCGRKKNQTNICKKSKKINQKETQKEKDTTETSITENLTLQLVFLNSMKDFSQIP